MEEGLSPPSMATIGRMLKHLKDKGQINAFLLGRKKKRILSRNHVNRYKRDIHEKLNRVQIDVDKYSLNSKTFYH